MPSTEITALLTQIWSKLGMILKIFKKFLNSIRNGYVPEWPQLKKAHWITYKFRESDQTVEISSLPSDLDRIIHWFLSSKRKKAFSYGTENGSKLKKYTIPRDCHRRYCVLSPSGGTQSKTGHRRCCQRPPPEKASRGPRTQQQVSKHVELPSSSRTQRLSVWRWWAPEALF